MGKLKALLTVRNAVLAAGATLIAVGTIGTLRNPEVLVEDTE